jgi:hypothetical protein
MDVPTDEDWQPIHPDELDETSAYYTFRGKTFDEAVALFEEASGYYQENLMYMPAPVFGFYLKAFMAYLMSEAARGDSDGASCFIGLIRFKAECDREILEPHWSSIEPVLKHLVEHQDDYEADWATYGSFRSQACEIVERGFEVTFDTSAPGVVPESATVGEMAYTHHPLSLPVALQILRNTGIHQIDERSTKDDIIRVFGLPQKSGSGKQSESGGIPDWFLFDHPLCTLRVEFDGELISGLAFLPPQGSCGVHPDVAKFLSPETLQKRAVLHAPPNLRGRENPKTSRFLDVLTRFKKLWRSPKLPES